MDKEDVILLIHKKEYYLELSYDPAIPLLGIYTEKTVMQKHSCIPVFKAALCTIAKTWKQPKCPTTEERLNKMWYTMEYYSATIRNGIRAFAATWMDLTITILSEISHTNTI